MTNSASENERSPLIPRREVHRPDFLITLGLIGDIAASILGMCLGYWIRFESGWVTFGVDAPNMVFGNYLGLIGVGTTFLLITFGYLKLYTPNNLLRFRRVAATIFRGATFWLFAYLGVSLAFKFEPPISRIYVACSYLCLLMTLLLWRMVFHKILRVEWVAKNLRQRIVFVGWNAEADRLVSIVENDPNHPYDIVGCVPSPQGRFQINPPPSVKQLGSYSDLPELIARNGLDIVVLADLDPVMGEIIGLSNLCEKEFVQFKIIPSYFQILVSGLQLETISGVPILGVSELPLDRLFNRVLKRVVDVVGAVVGLAISLPFYVVCGIRVYLESPGPIFFAQERIGRNGRRFKMYKIRSMRIGADRSDHLNQSTLREDPRVLRIGKFMRKWNIDETPQFWNVFVGDMSLVGPRPERTFHSEKLSTEIPHYNARYATKPGITGWAQVNGLRGDTSLVERVRYDLFYLENWSLWLDCQIMVQTFFKRDNAY